MKTTTFFLALLSSACGADPLIGTWESVTDPSAASDDSSAFEASLDFKANGAISETYATTLSPLAVATSCLTTITLAGAYKASGNAFTASFASGSTETTDCFSGSNDGGHDFSGAELAAVTSSYKISATTLTVQAPAIANGALPAETLVFVKR